MVAYVLDSYETNSSVVYKNQAKFTYTTNGTFRGVLAGNLQAKLTMYHKINLDEKDKYMTYYTTNKDNIIDINLGDVIYSLKFSEAPRTIPLGTDMWKIISKFEGIA